MPGGWLSPRGSSFFFMQESDFDLKQLHILVAENSLIGKKKVAGNSFSLEKKQGDIIICVLTLAQEQGSVFTGKIAIIVAFKEYYGKVP